MTHVKKHSIYAAPLDCTDCESVKTRGIIRETSNIPATGGTGGNQFYYHKSLLESPCNGIITYTISTDGIDNPCVNPRLDHIDKTYSSLDYVYFTADPNTDSVRKSFNLTIKYSNASLSNCTKEITIYQDAASAPSCVIPTQVSKGTVPVTGDKADKITFKKSGGGK